MYQNTMKLGGLVFITAAKNQMCNTWSSLLLLRENSYESKNRNIYLSGKD